MSERPNTDVSGRIQIALYLAGLVLSGGTAMVTLHIKNEVAETRIMILEKLTEASQTFTSRREFDGLQQRVLNLEVERRNR